MQSDVCNNVAVFAPHPDWHGFFDQDAPKAAATRRRVYDMLVAEKLPVQGYHFPFPALARIEKQGDGYRVRADGSACQPGTVTGLAPWAASRYIAAHDDDDVAVIASRRRRRRNTPARA